MFLTLLLAMYFILTLTLVMRCIFKLNYLSITSGEVLIKGVITTVHYITDNKLGVKLEPLYHPVSGCDQHKRVTLECSCLQ